MADRYHCCICQKGLEIEDVFTLTHAGPVLSLRPYCEKCCDTILESHRQAIAAVAAA